MNMGLLVPERYGKIYLTDTGFHMAKDLLRCAEVIRERLPALTCWKPEDRRRGRVHHRNGGAGVRAGEAVDATLYAARNKPGCCCEQRPGCFHRSDYPLTAPAVRPLIMYF